MADWAIGVIFAVHLERAGASYKATVERFCQGAPMNVTDCVVGPDGALYFSMGGRGTHGGVFRIVYRSAPHERTSRPTGGQAAPRADKPPVAHGTGGQAARGTWEAAGFRGLVNQPQPLAAWSRAVIAEQLGPRLLRAAAAEQFTQIARDGFRPARERIKALDLLQNYCGKPDPQLLRVLATDKDADVRAHAVFLLGLNREGRDALIKALRDEDALVRRRACEALIRGGFEPPVEALWPLLGDKDRFVRTAARLVLQRIDPNRWIDRLAKETDLIPLLEAIVALCKTNQASRCTDMITGRLIDAPSLFRRDEDLVNWLRTWQLVLVHTKPDPDRLKVFASAVRAFWAVEDKPVRRELAILLTHFGREKLLADVHTLLLDALLKAGDDRPQQIHYFYCLRLLREGWSLEQKGRLLAWYEGTKAWSGGHSFTPFLENILRDLNPIFTAEDRRTALAQGDRLPWAATMLLRMAPPDQLPGAQELAAFYATLHKLGPAPRAGEMKETVVTLLSRMDGPEGQAALRRVADLDPSQRDMVARSLAKHPSVENWPYLVRGLQATNPQTLVAVIQALNKIPRKPPLPAEPRPEDAAPFRHLLLASGRLEAKDKWKATELLRHWGGKKFAVEDGDWKTELEGWAKWFTQTFPKEPPLPNVTIAAGQSKWKYEELLAYLEKDPRGMRGDVANGRKVFEKASCLKCHKFGNEGEGLGPDLTTLKNRFKRADTLEAILHPSKVISDQYRGSTILTLKGDTITGLAAVQGDTVTVLQQDGTKVVLKMSEIDKMVASTLSPMPERLLDDLTREEIADLFAYLESDPPK